MKLMPVIWLYPGAFPEDRMVAQSFPDVEIAVVDDGSTDATPGILDWYAEKYANVVVIHQKNSGVAVARNARLYRSAKSKSFDVR